MEVDRKTSFRIDALLPASGDEVLCFDPATEQFYKRSCDAQEIERAKGLAKRMLAVEAAQDERNAALKWFAEHDWMVNKRALGEWAEDDARWVAYLEGRAQARANYDAAIAALENLK
jgi:hypothetical protein